MQLYRGLPILTNQSPAGLVGIWPLDHEGSVGEYQRLAHAAVDEILAAGRTPIVAGGTGLYLRAALAELDLPPAPPPGAREQWELLYDEAGPETAHARLIERDPAAAAVIHPNDRRRVVRQHALVVQDIAIGRHRTGADRRPPNVHADQDGGPRHGPPYPPTLGAPRGTRGAPRYPHFGASHHNKSAKLTRTIPSAAAAARAAGVPSPTISVSRWRP